MYVSVHTSDYYTQILASSPGSHNNETTWETWLIYHMHNIKSRHNVEDMN